MEWPTGDVTKKQDAPENTHKQNFPGKTFCHRAHYITAKKSITCKNSPKQISEHILKPPFNSVILYKAQVTVPVCQPMKWITGIMEW